MPGIKDRVDKLNERLDYLLMKVSRVRDELLQLQESVKGLEDLCADERTVKPKPTIVERPMVEAYDEAEDETEDFMMWAARRQVPRVHYKPSGIRRARRVAMMQQRLNGLQMSPAEMLAEELSDEGWVQQPYCIPCGHDRSACKCIQGDRVAKKPSVAKKPPAQSSPTFGRIPEEVQTEIAVALVPLVSRELPKTFEELAELIAVLHNVRETLRTFPERPDPRVKLPGTRFG